LYYCEKTLTIVSALYFAWQNTFE